MIYITINLISHLTELGDGIKLALSLYILILKEKWMILDPPKGKKKIIVNKIFYFKLSSFLLPLLKAPILSFTINLTIGTGESQQNIINKLNVKWCIIFGKNHWESTDRASKSKSYAFTQQILMKMFCMLATSLHARVESSTHRQNKMAFFEEFVSQREEQYHWWLDNMKIHM